jgi:hypothetical protein
MDRGGHDDGAKPGFFASRANIVLIGFLAIAGFYLITEHTAHVIPYLPWLLLLACPFLHFFMHGSHGGHGDGQGSDRNKPGDLPASPHQH